MAILSDAKIALLLADPKPIRRRKLAWLKIPGKPNSRSEGERCLTITSDNGRVFRVVACKKRRPFQFSIILAFTWYRQQINLVRCNGHHREHTNKIEDRTKSGVRGIPANTFHIHYATQRYQLAGQAAESYAEPTSDYFSFESAIEFLCSRFGFYLSDDTYPMLYPLFGPQA
ncbi:MAG: hypothetical protein WD872_08605 [Pirellulaceae bacterium]